MNFMQERERRQLYTIETWNDSVPHFISALSRRLSAILSLSHF
jgi:hypothetical protein